MNNSPFFTIVIPTHNRASLLKRAIQSVLDQRFENWEIIVVDDDSVDHTTALVQSFSEQDHRIKYFYQKHQERSVARNLGIQHANGTYLCFLDDDDYFLPLHLEILYQHIENESFPKAIFRTGMITTHNGKNRYGPFFNPRKDDNPIYFFLNNMVGIHTLCFHQEVLQKHHFDERWFHFQDTHLLIRCLLDYPFRQINEHTSVYVRYPEMGSLNIFRQENAVARTENNVGAIRDLFQQGGQALFNYVPKGLEKYLVAKKYLDHAGGALHIGRRKLARVYIKKSIQERIIPKLASGYIKFLIRYALSYLG